MAEMKNEEKMKRSNSSLVDEDLEQVAGGDADCAERTCRYLSYVNTIKSQLDDISIRLLEKNGRDAVYLRDLSTMEWVLDQCSIDSVFTKEMRDTIMAIFNS